MKQIPIFFTFDNNYVVPASVALFSLLNKAKTDVFYIMHILHSDITVENQQLIRNSISEFSNFSLTFTDTKDFLKNEWQVGNFENHQMGNQFTKETLIKCFASKFFPQYEKIIYSDVDIVVNDDISELIDINLEDKYIAAVKDAFLKWDKSELSHLSPEIYEKFKNSYFGGGIWVLNLKKIREDNLEARMIEIIKDDSIPKRWPDQDIMNIACDNNVKFLPLNYISYPYLLERLLLPDFKSDFSRKELYDSIINPKIVHFAGIKPWSGNPKFSEVWWNIFYYLKLPKTSIFFKEKMKLKYKILYKIWNSLNKKLKQKGYI